MVTVTAPNAKTLRRLKAKARRLGVTQDQIAATAEVTRPAVVNVFAGRTRSARIVEVAKRLIAEAEEKAKDTAA